MKKLLHSLLFLLICQLSLAQTSGIELDGTEGYISLCHDDNYVIDEGFTVEAWIFADQWKSEFWQGSIINKDRHVTADTEGFTLRAGANGSLSFVVATGVAWPEVISGPVMNAKQWYHVAGVYQSGTASLYINGEFVKSAPIPGTPSANLTSDLTIGDSPGWPGRVFNGIIDEVRVWNIARSAEEIANNTTTSFTGEEDGLVAYLPMNEGSGSITANLVDSDCNGAVVQGTWTDGYSIPEFDLGVTAISAPDILSLFSRPVQVQVEVQNYGSESVSTIPVALTINGLPSLSETFITSLEPGESKTVVFSKPLNLTGNTTNLISARTVLDSDGNDLNDEGAYRYKKPSNDNSVTIINEEQHNFGGAGQTKSTLVNLPKNVEDFERILLHFDLECPITGCDPWDQPAKISVETAEGDVEIARFITPYGIECGPWTVDVSDFKSILKGPTNIKSFIQVFGQSGWLLNCDIEFVSADLPAFSKMAPLWETDYLVYGDPSVMSDDLPAVSTVIADNTKSGHMRMTISGHGQGNTNNAAEFFNVTHQIVVDNEVAGDHNLWKNDCGQNPCSNQGGNWTPSRAGWCPGQEVRPYVFDLTDMMTVGQELSLDYELQDYTNLLNTGYNNTGHTEPHYRIFSYLIEESDTRYGSFVNIRADKVLASNDGSNLTGVDFTMTNTGSEMISEGTLAFYINDELVAEEVLAASIEAGATYQHSFSNVEGLNEGDLIFAVVTSTGDEVLSDNVVLGLASLTSSIPTVSQEDLKIFPNPSSGRFTIEVGRDLLSGELEIIDIQGRVVQKVPMHDDLIYLDILEKGIYTVVVRSEKNSGVYGKIVVH